MSEKSLFASALQQLLDDTNLFNRNDWAEIIGARTTDINKWVYDADIPEAHHLGMIIATLETSSNIPELPLKHFREIASLRSTLVSPHGKRMLPSVQQYIERPLFSEINRKLAKMTPDQQAKFLEIEFPEAKNE